MNYKTTFKKSKFNVYRINDSFKCVASCVLEGIDPKDTVLVRKLSKKFKDIKITKSGISFEVVAFSKCHEKDNFDESKGKQLAESRCKKKVFQKATKIMQCVVKFKEEEYLKALVSYQHYGCLSDIELDHVMSLDEKRIYKIDEIHNSSEADTLDVKLVDLEFNSEIKESKDMSGLASIKDETIKRFKLKKGDMIYFDLNHNSSVIFKATEMALNIRRERFEEKFGKKDN